MTVGHDSRGGVAPVVGGTRIGWLAVTWLAGLLGLAVVVAGVLASYFQVDVAASLSFWGNDGWCDPAVSGLGVHCFGDYAAIRFPSLTDMPIPPEDVYPLSTRIVRLPFWLIERVGGARLAMVAFLATAVVAVLSPVLWAVRSVPWREKPIVLTVAGIATTPFLVAIDRGQILALAVPLLFGFLLTMVQGKPWSAALFIIGAATIKPQFMVLGLALLTYRHWRVGAAAVLGSCLAITLPFLLLGPRSLEGVRNWVKASTTWSASTPLSTDWPTNLSLSHMLRTVFVTGRETLAALGLASSEHVDIGARGDNVFVLASLVLVGMCAAAVVLWGRALHPVVVGSLFLALASFSLPLTYLYYAVVALPIFAVAFGFGVTHSTSQNERLSGIGILLVAALTVTLSPLVIPIASPVAGKPVPILLSIVVPAAWLAFMVAVALEAVRNRAQTRPTLMRVGGGEPVDV